MINGIVSFICLSILLLLVYRNETDFCVLILYPETSLSSLMSSGSLLVISLGLSMYSIMSSADSDSFTTSLIWIPFIYFTSLIAMARTFKTVLNKSGKTGHSCLILYLWRNAFSFSPLSMMLAVGLSYMAFIMFIYVPSISIFWSVFFFFNHKWMLNFVSSFSCI